MRNLIMEILERIAISMFFSLFPSLLVCVQNFQTRAIDQDTEVTSNQGFFIFFRYWSHVVNCNSCRVAIKGLNVLEIVLEVVSVAAIGILAATKQSLMSVSARTALVSMAVL